MSFFGLHRVGESFFDMDRSDLEAKYTRITPETAQQEWSDIYTSSLTTCSHGAQCNNKATCQVRCDVCMHDLSVYIAAEIAMVVC